MKKIVFHSSRELEYFPDIIEYIKNIKKYSNNEVYYIGFYKNKKEKKYFSNLNIKVFNIDHKISLKNRLKHLRMYINEIDPDILHVFHYRGSGLIPFILFREKIKCILDVRTLHVEDKKGNPNTGLSLFLKDKLTWLETIGYGQSLALTPAIQKKLSPSRNTVPIIPLGANLELFKSCSNFETKIDARSILELEKDDIVFLYSGVLTPSRKMEIPIEVISKMAAEQKNISFLIVGGTYFDNYVDRLRNIPIRFGVPDKIRFVGRVPYQEIPKFYAAADIGISFTPADTAYATQPPTKIIEYLMSGMLVVSNRTPAVHELVIDQKTGFLSDDSPEGFEDAIRSAISYFKYQTGYAEKAIESVAHFSWEKIVQNKLLPLYDRMAN